MQALPLILMGAGTIMSTVSQIQQARGEAEAASMEAESIRESAAFEEGKSRRETAQIIARQRAMGAASGIDISTGSPLMIQLDSARQAEMEALAIQRSGINAANAKKFERDQALSKIPGIGIGGALSLGSAFAGSPQGAGLLGSLLTKKTATPVRLGGFRASRFTARPAGARFTPRRVI